MKKELKGVLGTKTEYKPFTLEYEETEEMSTFLDKIYELLDCQMIEVQHRKFGDKYYTIICDEEGTYIHDNFVSIITIDDYFETIEQIVGNVFICTDNADGDDFASLTGEEQAQVLCTISPAYDETGKELKKVLVATL